MSVPVVEERMQIVRPLRCMHCHHQFTELVLPVAIDREPEGITTSNTHSYLNTKCPKCGVFTRHDNLTGQRI